MAFVFDPPPRVALPILGTDDLLPVHRVYCVGRNYAEHAREFGNDPTEPPFFFQKNPDSLVLAPHEVEYPPMTGDLQYEVELVVALHSGGRDIPDSDALNHVFGYAVGIDMTRRDLQAEAKRLRRPWEIAKAFEQSAPIGPIVMAPSIGHPARGAISLDLNGTLRQRGDLVDMSWDVPKLIANLSSYFDLRAGDLIFTGTPAGVGPVNRGDRIHAHIDLVGDLAVTIV
jgi:fumarylpyruvate hydrolase